MWRPFVSQDNTAIRLTSRLALDQHRHLHFEPGDLGVLTGDNLVEVVHEALKMGQLFFDLCHAPCIAKRTGLPSRPGAAIGSLRWRMRWPSKRKPRAPRR